MMTGGVTYLVTSSIFLNLSSASLFRVQLPALSSLWQSSHSTFIPLSFAAFCKLFMVALAFLMPPSLQAFTTTLSHLVAMVHLSSAARLVAVSHVTESQ